MCSYLSKVMSSLSHASLHVDLTKVREMSISSMCVGGPLVDQGVERGLTKSGNS
jgi:hypothetical protein